MSPLLRRLDYTQVAARRRANYGVLLDALRGLVPAPFDRLPDGASPFAFPIKTTAKAAVLARLSELGVQAMDLWSVPHPSLPTERFPGASARRTSTVCLPVHQELRRADLDRLVRAVQAAAIAERAG